MAEIENNAAVVVDQAPPPPAEARRGRQRVEMKRMENEKNLQVTFSKRRTGLFKKASELCTLCGVEMALVVFSPSGKVYSFGNPSVNAVLDRYSTYAAGGDGGVVVGASAVDELNARLAELRSEVEAERKRGKAMNQQRREAVAAGRWWEAPLETIQDEAQLTQLAEALENLKSGVKLRNDRIFAETTAAIAALAGPIYGNCGGGGGQAVPPFTDYMNNNNIYNNNNNNVVAYPYNNGFF